MLTSVSKVFKESSKTFCYLEMTFPNNCCSKPVWVTVKSIIVVLAESSGENEGFGSRQVIKSSKDLLKSKSTPDILINALPFFF